MINRMRMSAHLSSRLLSCSLFSDFTPKQGIPNPFLFLYYSTIHTSNQYTLRLSDLDNAFDSITNINEAVALFHYMLQMKPKPPSVCDYNNLFASIVKIQHYSQDVKMEHYSQVICMFKTLILLGYPVDVYIMNTVVNCYAHLKQIDLGFGIVAAFIKRGYLPNDVTFTCLIKGYFLQGQVVKAVDLFKKVVRDKACLLQGYIIPTVLNGLSKSGNVGGAIELLQFSEKKDWKVSVVGYNVVIDGLCRARMLKQGMDLLLRMVDIGILPDVVSYNCFMHALCMNGKLDFACNIFNELPSKGINPNVITYTVLIQGFCREGLFSDAKEMLEKMEQAGCFPNSITYNIIVQGCLHHRDNSDSSNLLKQIVGRDFQLNGPSFFVSLRRIQLLQEMKGIYDDDIINQLILKLISSDVRHDMQDPRGEFMVQSFINKLTSSDSKCSV